MKDFNQEEAYIRAKKRLDKLKGFYWHLAWYIIVNTFLIITIARNLDSDETIWQFGTFATAFFWGIGLFFHFMGVFGLSIFFSKDWENRKIEEYMNKDKRNWE
jgi:2TM domain